MLSKSQKSPNRDDSKKDQFFEGANSFTNNISNFGEKIFKNEQEIPEDDHKIKKDFDEWNNKKSTNPIAGFTRGLVSFGHQTILGVTGVIVEPIKGAAKDGGAGFLMGVGRGLTGLVTKPVAGIVQLGAKTAEGIVNTPQGIADAIEGLQTDKDLATPLPCFFGRPLAESFEIAAELKITHPLLLCINFLKRYGIEAEGIFRLSGSSGKIKEWKTLLDQGVLIDFDEETSVHCVAGLLKTYLRELPKNDGLVPSGYFIFTKQDDEKAIIQKSVAILTQLPPINRSIFTMILSLLQETASKSDINKMTISNLSVCMAPNLFRSKATDEQDSLMQQSPSNEKSIKRTKSLPQQAIPNEASAVQLLEDTATMQQALSAMIVNLDVIYSKVHKNNKDAED